MFSMKQLSRISGFFVKEFSSATEFIFYFLIPVIYLNSIHISLIFSKMQLQN